MANLEELILQRVNGATLERLAALRKLRTLLLDDCRVDYKSVERLTSLRSLSVGSATPEEAPVLASLDLGNLPELREIHIGFGGAPVSQSFEMEGFPPHELEVFAVASITLDDDVIDRAASLRGLEHFAFTPRDPEQYEYARRRLVGVGIMTLEPGPVPSGLIQQSPTGGGERVFSVGVDLAALYGLETNVEAYEELLETLKAAGLDDRVEVDVESSEVRMLSKRREDLERALRALPDRRQH